MSNGQIWLFVGLTAATLLLSVAATLFVLVRLPADYFKARRRLRRRNSKSGTGPLVLRILKNIAGALVIALGLVLSVPGVPGQGILTILIGIMLLDFPGKYRLERRILSIRRVRSFIDRLRVRFGKPAFQL